MTIAKTLLFLLASLACFPRLRADITVINDIVIPQEIYDFVYSSDSTTWWRSKNRTSYYCIFRSLWTKESAPNDYPNMARVTDPVMYSTTKEYRPWLKGRATTRGIEKIAEVSTE